MKMMVILNLREESPFAATDFDRRDRRERTAVFRAHPSRALLEHSNHTYFDVVAKYEITVLYCSDTEDAPYVDTIIVKLP